MSVGYNMTGVGFVRAEVRKLIHAYDKVRDCIAGAHVIKEARMRYLPMPNPMDQSKANIERYAQYLLRAVFYNATRRTVFGMVGQIFMRDPQIEAPQTPTWEALMQDANGEGVSLQQHMMTTSLYVLSYGRAGILTDYPAPANAQQIAIGGPGAGITPMITQAELAAGDVMPVFRVYHSREITNWRKARRGTKTVLTLVVIENWFTVDNDGFAYSSTREYIVLRLMTREQAMADMVNNPTLNGAIDYVAMFNESVNSDTTDMYKYEVWRTDGAGANSMMTVAQRYYPTDSNGKFLNEIPFRFVGVDKNDDQCAEPPVYDLAELNVAHYRNSADYEEACYIAGQPTFVVSGLTEEWAKTILKGKLSLGARGGIPLPVGASAQLLQVQSNSMPKEAMDTKERQMVALGAKLIEQRSVSRTATEASIESTAESTILGNIAKNVGMAWQNAMQDACKYTGDDPKLINVKLNTEFELTRMDPQDRLETLTEWMNDAITFSEMRANFRRGGVATLDDAEAQTALNAQAKQKQQQALDSANAMGAIMAKHAPPPDPNNPNNNQPGGGPNSDPATPGNAVKTPGAPKKPSQPGGGQNPNQS